MQRTPLNPHAFDEEKLAHESKQRTVDRILEYEADTRQRVDTLVKAIFVLSGGALTISIGIFLKDGAPKLTPDLQHLLQRSWWLLFYSLASAATVLFVMIVQGYWYSAQHANSVMGKGYTNPAWGDVAVRIVNWVLGVSGFVSFLVGLWLLAHVSVNAVTARPSPSAERIAPGHLQAPQVPSSAKR